MTILELGNVAWQANAKNQTGFMNHNDWNWFYIKNPKTDWKKYQEPVMTFSTLYNNAKIATMTSDKPYGLIEDGA